MMGKVYGQGHSIFFVVVITLTFTLSGCGGTISSHALGTPGKPLAELARLYSKPDPFIEQVDLQVGPNKSAGNFPNESRPMVFNSAFDGSGTVIVDAGVAHLVKLFCRGGTGGNFDLKMRRSPTRYFAVTPAPGELITFSLLNSRNPHPNPACNVVADSANAVQIDAQEAEKMLAWIQAGRPTAATTPQTTAPVPTVRSAPAQAISAPAPEPEPVKENVTGKVLE